MKRIFLIILLITSLSFLFTSCYQAPKYDITVCTTSTGAKYHKSYCRYVKNKAIEINLSKAIYDGLQPCKVCHPPIQKDLDKLNK